MVGEHLDDGRRFRPPLFIGFALPARHGSMQHHLGYRQRLGTFVVQQRIYVGDEFADAGIQFQSLAKTGDEATGHGMTLDCLLYIRQAERAYPEVRSTRHRVGSCQGLAFRGGVRKLTADVLHPGNLGNFVCLLLSQAVIFDSISLTCFTNPVPLPPQ